MRRVDYLIGEIDFNTLIAAQFMTQDAVKFSKTVSAESIGAALVTGNFGSVPILDSDFKPIGLVSEYDLLKAVRQGKDLRKISAEEIMTKPAVTVSGEAKVEEIMKILEDSHLIRLPVIDHDGKLLGMVARRDLVHGYLRSKVPAKVWWM